MNRLFPIPGFEAGNDFFEIGLMAAASADFAAAMGRRIAESLDSIAADYSPGITPPAAAAPRPRA